MRKVRLAVVVAALVGVVYSVVSFAAVTGIETGSGQQVVVFEGSDVGGSCTCPTNFDPVVCGSFPNAHFYSNACVAGCAGASNCHEIEIQLP